MKSTMFMRRSAAWRLLLLVGLIGAIAVRSGSAAQGRVADAGILNQTQVEDPVGDTTGPDLSSLTVTTYTDGSVSFAAQFANREFLHPDETAQIFVDLNDDRTQDLNLSVWPTGEPSYLAHWTGSNWANVRQLPELAQRNGSFSVRLSLSELRDAAAVPVATAFGVIVETGTTDSTTGELVRADALPDDQDWIVHQIQPPAPPAATTTSRLPTTAPSRPAVRLGGTVYLKRRTRTRHCTLGPLPDRRCSPGAYYSGLSKKSICSAGFHASSIPHLKDAEKRRVKQEYGLAPKSYGNKLEIDHIVSLELGGSNDIANLYPERATFSDHSPGYHIKDKLENRLHDLVCAGEMSLASARHQIASDWEKLYAKVFGATP
jgi:hypothetical protein